MFFFITRQRLLLFSDHSAGYRPLDFGVTCYPSKLSKRCCCDRSAVIRLKCNQKFHMLRIDISVLLVAPFLDMDILLYLIKRQTKA